MYADNILESEGEFQFIARRYGYDKQTHIFECRIPFKKTERRSVSGSYYTFLICAKCQRHHIDLFCALDRKWYCRECLGIRKPTRKKHVYWDVPRWWKDKYRLYYHRYQMRCFLQAELAILKMITYREYFELRPELVPSFIARLKFIDKSVYHKLLTNLGSTWKHALLSFLSRQARAITPIQERWLFEQMKVRMFLGLPVHEDYKSCLRPITPFLSDQFASQLSETNYSSKKTSSGPVMIAPIAKEPENVPVPDVMGLEKATS